MQSIRPKVPADTKALLPQNRDAKLHSTVTRYGGEFVSVLRTLELRVLKPLCLQKGRDLLLTTFMVIRQGNTLFSNAVKKQKIQPFVVKKRIDLLVQIQLVGRYIL